MKTAIITGEARRSKTRFGIFAAGWHVVDDMVVIEALLTPNLGGDRVTFKLAKAADDTLMAGPAGAKQVTMRLQQTDQQGAYRGLLTMSNASGIAQEFDIAVTLTADVMSAQVRRDVLGL